MKDVHYFMVSLTATFLIAVSCTMPSSGNGGVAGVVKESSSNEPVEGVSVKYGGMVHLTDAFGRYAIDTIPDGLQGITFSKTGFTTMVSQVDVHRDEVIENNVFISVMSTGWAVGDVETEYGSIFYTDNGGVSWVRQGNYSVIPPDNLRCVCAVNEKCCWVGGDTTFNVLRNRMEYSILKTSDAGTSWRRQGQVIGSLSPFPVVGITAMDTSTVFAVTDTNMIISGTSGGSYWSLCLSSDHVTSFKAISTCDGVHLWAGGTAIEGGELGVEYSPDSGYTWNFLPVSGTSEHDIITDISAVDTNLIYISGSFGIKWSEDKGNTWASIPDVPSARTITTLGTFNVWTFLENGTLRYTLDGFTSLKTSVLSASVDKPSVTAISFLGDVKNGALTYVSGEKTAPGGILYSCDYGASWTEASIPFKVSLNEISFAGTRH